MKNALFPKVVKSFAVVSLAASMFAACGDDSGTSVKDDESSSSIVEESSSSLAKSSSSISSGLVKSSSSVASSSSEVVAVSSSSVESSSSDVTAASSSSVIPSGGEESSSSSSEVIQSSSSEESSSSIASSSSVSSSSAESSSSVESSSSSEEKKSISYEMQCPAGMTCTYAPTERLNPEIAYGELLDSRDNQIYKTVTIGNQTWIAQNLNYAYVEDKYDYMGYTSDSTSWCYGNKSDNCDKYGRLYTWSAAMDSAGRFSAAGKGCGFESRCDAALYSSTIVVRGICPEGWHLPSDTEWRNLFNAVGGKNVAGKQLKSTAGWDDNGNGLDAFGFAILPAGRCYGDSYGTFGSWAYFWASSQGSHDYDAYYWDFRSYYSYAVPWDGGGKNNGFSVRCLKDNS